MSSFLSVDDATRIERIDDLTFRAEVPDGWQQGRGAFGGVVIALCLRALDAVQADPARPLRVASAQIPSPVLVGETILEVRVLRRGSGVDALEVVLKQEGEIRARATGIYGKPRDVDVVDHPQAPVLPPVPDPLPMPATFAASFEMRSTGPLPFTQNDEAVVEGWLRPCVPFAQVGAPEIACLCDVYWPAFFAQVSGLRPSGTIGYTLQLTPEAYALKPDELVFYRARQLHAAAGFAHELRELWNDRGELLALNPQTFAIIR